MKTIARCFLFIMLVSASVQADEPSFQDAFLDRLVGTWLMEGTIAGDQVTHDLVVEWVLAHQYVQIRERSREKDASGNPAYESIVYIGWDPERKDYACLWLDITGSSGFEPVGHGVREGDAIPFVFGTGDDGRIHNTFRYDRAHDRWTWSIDNERAGERSPFARVTLQRK